MKEIKRYFTGIQSRHIDLDKIDLNEPEGEMRSLRALNHNLAHHGYAASIGKHKFLADKRVSQEAKRKLMIEKEKHWKDVLRTGDRLFDRDKHEHTRHPDDPAGTKS